MIKKIETPLIWKYTKWRNSLELLIKELSSYEVVDRKVIVKMGKVKVISEFELGMSSLQDELVSVSLKRELS